MGRDLAAGVVVVFVALIALVAVFVGALGGSTTVTFDQSPSVPAPIEGEGGLVYGKHETGGTNLLGFQFRERDRWLSVGFVAPNECIQQSDDGERVVVTSGACGELPGSGKVEGGGITPAQVEWVTVRVDVSRACLEAVGVGDRWPSDVAACGGSQIRAARL